MRKYCSRHLVFEGILAISVACSSLAHATADGPDFYKVQNLPIGKQLYLQTIPETASKGEVIPLDATCLRNLGCQGGLTLQEFTSLSEDDQRVRLAANPRWCKVQYRGATGWIPGQFLAEAACSDQGAPAIVLPSGPAPQKASGVVRGNDGAVYLVKALAGQTLVVNLRAKHPQTYFNVTLVGSKEAMFIGSSTGNSARLRIPADGDYLVDVYLMRAAARRGALSAFTLSAGVTGQALTSVSATKDALVAGTQFHATAMVPCAVPYDPSVTNCSVGVIRRALKGTATVQISWPGGVRNILFVHGKASASDSAQKMTSTKIGDSTKVMFGTDERFEIPDALIFGG